MTRKTKAEKQAEQEATMAAFKAQEAAEYGPRLMRALEEATTKNGYDLTVHDGQFKLVDFNASYLVDYGNDYQTYTRKTYLFNPSYTTESFMELEDLEYRLHRLEEERVESNRLYNLKQEALSKLTDEERQVLGLSKTF